MRFISSLSVATVCLLALSGCAGTPPSEFKITSKSLEPQEIPLDSFGRTAFAAQVFDVVNQDVTAENNTGIAGKVDPMPVDILSSYAAKKFRAAGGALTTRFVIRKGEFVVRPVEKKETGWLFDTTTYKAELSTNLNVMLVASRANGQTANITATTTQSQEVSLDASPDKRREAYIQLMNRAVQAIDNELNKELPKWFDDVVVR